MPGAPKICLSLTESTLSGNLSIVEAERTRIDLIELRADHLLDSELVHARKLPRLSGVPAILSFRRSNEGGTRQIGEAKRLQLLDAALEGDWTYVDLEDDLEAPFLDTKAAKRGVGIIRSYHDLDGVPENLSSRIGALARSVSEVPKVVVVPHSTSDLLQILDASDALGGRAGIVVGMGEWGFPTRVLPARFASSLTYCSAGMAAATPGQVTPAVLRTVYRVGEIDASASVYCVIGNPVLHSRSPWIHNPGLRRLDLDAVYIPIQVDDLTDFMQLAERLDIRGASVTIPHKEAVRPLLAVSDRSVAEAGACNTLVRTGRGWTGFNTDIEGFLGPLRARLGNTLAGSSALVVGAGGAARGVVSGLVRSGCRVTVVNRTERRAQALAGQFDCDWVSIDDVEEGFRIVVQATSVGMTPNEDADPLPGYRFRGDEIVYDLIYAPERTRFLERAAKAGCSLIGGREMLRRQAFAQFRLFTGLEYPSDIHPL